MSLWKQPFRTLSNKLTCWLHVSFSPMRESGELYQTVNRTPHPPSPWRWSTVSHLQVLPLPLRPRRAGCKLEQCRVGLWCALWWVGRDVLWWWYSGSFAQGNINCLEELGLWLSAVCITEFGLRSLAWLVKWSESWLKEHWIWRQDLWDLGCVTLWDSAGLVFHQVGCTLRYLENVHQKCMFVSFKEKYWFPLVSTFRLKFLSYKKWINVKENTE